MSRDKREIIFDMPNTYGEYRVVCRFGYDSLVDYAWWGYVQKKVTFKLWPWGKGKELWVEIDDRWWDKEIKTLAELKEHAIKLYDENIEAPIRVRQRAMSLK